jgi:hypothetical protein
VTALVGVGKPGRKVIIRQLRVETPPYTNCRVIDYVRMLAFGGLAIPDRPALVRALRHATGVPEVDPKTGLSQGTAASDLQRAVAILLPWVPFDAALWYDAGLLESLRSGAIVASVSVPVYNALPGSLARWSPRFGGGHQIGLAGARQDPDGAWWVLWVDVLGTGSYRGEWVRWTQVKPFLGQYAGRVFVTTMEKGAALSTATVLERVYSSPASVVVPKGTATWSFDTRTNGLEAAKPATDRTTGTTDAIVRVTQLPIRKPRGRFVRLSGAGELTGRYVDVEDVRITDPTPTTPAADIDKVRSEAFAQGRDAGRAEFEPVTDQLFRPVSGV